MKQVEQYEEIRRAYFIDKMSIRAIHRRYGYDRDTIRKAITQAAPQPYQLQEPRAAPVLGPYKEKITDLLEESAEQRRKQRYTGHRIYELLVEQGYQGSEGAVRNYICQQRKAQKLRKSFLPLEFDPGKDAQVDWGEAEVEMNGERIMVQMFILRLNYSRVRFVMAFPFQKQEAFFEGHIRAFHFLGGVPGRISYDNLKTAVYKILTGRNRQEQRSFKAFRSYYLFESHYCTPGQGHEKGGVENDVGYVQRNFMAPVLKVDSYEALNQLLHTACLQNVQRHVRGQDEPVAELWESEKSLFLPLPGADYPACNSHPVKPNGYSQVGLDTNRYSVPVECKDNQLVLHAYSFRVVILSDQKIVAEHARCFEKEQDILNPLHYLALLEQRPGAFEYAKPIRRWRKEWPADYHRLLDELRQRWPEGRGVKEFISILKLHLTHPAGQIEQAVGRAIELGATHLAGVQFCLQQILEGPTVPPPLDLSLHPQLAQVGNQPVNLQQYDQLLGEK
jgi:transposase